jgi:hypothetical protein
MLQLFCTWCSQCMHRGEHNTRTCMHACISIHERWVQKTTALSEDIFCFGLWKSGYITYTASCRCKWFHLNLRIRQRSPSHLPVGFGKANQWLKKSSDIRTCSYATRIYQHHSCTPYCMQVIRLIHRTRKESVHANNQRLILFFLGVWQQNLRIFLLFSAQKKLLKKTTKGVLSSFKVPKFLQDSPSHRIFEHMHGALNIGKKNN